MPASELRLTTPAAMLHPKPHVAAKRRVGVAEKESYPAFAQYFVRCTKYCAILRSVVKLSMTSPL